MIEPFSGRPRAITLGADKAYDTKDFIKELRSMKVTPHVAQNLNGRRSPFRLSGQLAHSQAHRGGVRLDQDRRRAGQDQVPWPRPRRMAFTFAAAAYNLVRLPKLIAVLS